MGPCSVEQLINQAVIRAWLTPVLAFCEDPLFAQTTDQYGGGDALVRRSSNALTQDLCFIMRAGVRADVLQELPAFAWFNHPDNLEALLRSAFRQSKGGPERRYALLQSVHVILSFNQHTGRRAGARNHLPASLPLLLEVRRIVDKLR